MITILDYGMGNMGSMSNMFKRIGVKTCFAKDVSRVASAEKLVLPGVGSYDAAMEQINSVPGLREALDKKALEDRIPILGVCLGMQILVRSSEEGGLPGLGWLSGEARRIPSDGGLKVPHMGWNVARLNSPSKLTREVALDSRYYFVHSYCVHMDDPVHALTRTRYGIDFDSAIGCDNIYGVQFHPEKSHRFGMQILKNFAAL
jgi:glutamine amidotransferase